MTWRIEHGDMREVLPVLALTEALFDACVTDPPYGLAFMGKDWDSAVPGPDYWRAASAVLKPGAHLVAFGGTRTWHRMAVAIEDAGFEIRDTLMWLYGTGFPKSHDVAQSIEKLLTTGKARRPDRDLGGLSRHRFSGSEDGALIADTGGKVEITTPEAAEWQGWGTALKPAWEPIIVARKPLCGTVAQNVLAHGTGALNIDGCRVGAEIRTYAPKGTSTNAAMIRVPGHRAGTAGAEMTVAGRWPANVVHDGSDEVEAAFAAFGERPGQIARESSSSSSSRNNQNTYGAMRRGSVGREPREDFGSASRFFYCAKASRQDREEGCETLAKRPLLWSAGEQNPGSFQSTGTEKAARNNHPTVKPTELMRWLLRLVTPPGGRVLDPFAGSGSTGKAALLEGFRFTGVEQDEAYVQIARARIGWAASRAVEDLL